MNHSIVASQNLKIGLFFAILATALFSVKAIFIKLAFIEGVDSTTLLTLRMLIAAPLYFTILMILLYRKPIKSVHCNFKNGMMIMLIGFCGYYLAPLLDFKGLFYVSAQLERLALFTYPTMVALLSWLILSEKMTLQIWISLFLTYFGVILLFSYESLAQTKATTLGTSLILLAALSFSFYVILSKTYIHRFGSLVFTCLAMLSASFFILVHFFIIHPISDLNVNIKVWIFAAAIAVFSTLIPSFFLSEAISRIGGTRTSIAGSFGPVFTVILAISILGEDFSWFHFFGMLFVILGVINLNLTKKKP